MNAVEMLREMRRTAKQLVAVEQHPKDETWCGAEWDGDCAYLDPGHAIKPCSMGCNDSSSNHTEKK